MARSPAKGTTTSQHAAGTASNTLVGFAAVTRARFAVVGAVRLAPLPRTHVGSVQTLFINAACSFGAYWETLFRSQKTLATTITQHHSARMTLWGNLSPTCPWNRFSASAAAAATSTTTTST